MKLGKLVNKNTQVLLSSLMGKNLPAKTAFRVKNVVKKTKEEVDHYNEVRDQLLTKYGNKKEDGTLEISEDGNVQFTVETYKEFVAELNDLNNLEVEITPISITDFGNVEFTGEELFQLDELISE